MRTASANKTLSGSGASKCTSRGRPRRQAGDKAFHKKGTQLEEAILTNANDFMAKHGIADADLDRMAAPYEDGSFELEPDSEALGGSHLDAVDDRVDACSVGMRSHPC